MKLVFISSFQYPYCTATTNRHLSYGRGLVELGHSVHFLLLYPQNSDLFRGNILIYNGILLECLTLRKNNNQLTNLKKALCLLYWIKQAKSRLMSINKNEHVDALVLLDIKAFILNSFIKFGRGLNIRIFHESTEYPFVEAGNSIRRKLNLYYYLHNTIQKFDGIYVISDALANYFRVKTKGKVHVEIINMTVEPDRFEKETTQNSLNFEYIAYCGTMYGDKDGIPILIEAFRKISGEWPNMKLVIIGDNSNFKKFDPILKQIARSNMVDRVVFTGLVSRDQMPNLLNNAKILALARPNNKQAEGGFPIKLGEYLATAKPVVITSVGEISNFLHDGINAYIAQPGDTENFAIKLCQALHNYNDAIKIGKEGNKLVHEVFNYKVQAKKLAQFIEENL